MYRAFRSTLAAVAAFACLVASAPQSADAAGDPRPPLSDLVSFSTINEWIARVGLLFVRSVVDLTYQDITNDPYANRTTVTGIVIRPALPWDRGRQCRILAERLSLSFAELGDWDRIAIRLELTGVTAPLACLPPDAAGMATVSEIANLAADRVFVDIDYRMSSSAMRVNVHMTLPDLAAVTVNLDFADVKTVMMGAGPAWMAIGHGRGENRAEEAAKAAMAIARSKPEPCLGSAAGDRLIVSFRDGSGIPEFWAAARTRSRASPSAASGRPMRTKAGSCCEMSASISTTAPSMPSSAIAWARPTGIRTRPRDGRCARARRHGRPQIQAGRQL